ncbi:radical SAM/SPASM domain-containing protein [Clostridia bacterium]|nr:radical SAM/SPASM domain-containing protein [Clostridia bacterium]
MRPLTMLVKPASSLCNCACRYCFYRDVAGKREDGSSGVMSEQTLNTLVRKAFAYADGCVSICFQGGEPMMAGLEFYRRFISLVRAYNTRGTSVSLFIQTNGLLIDDEWAEFFKDNGFLVGVSLDGPQSIHDANRVGADGKGTYSYVIDAINILKQHKTLYNILCVVTSQSASESAELFDELSPHGYLQFIPCIGDFDSADSPYAPTAEAYGDFLKAVFDRYELSINAGHAVSVRNLDNYIIMLAGYPPEQCGMTGVCGLYYLVEADGSVYPCDFYALDTHKLGDINTDSIPRLAKARDALAFTSSSAIKHPDCPMCKWFALCKGGCRRDCEPYTNGQPSLNRYCEGLKGFFEYAYPRMEQLAKKVTAGV